LNGVETIYKTLGAVFATLISSQDVAVTGKFLIIFLFYFGKKTQNPARWNSQCGHVCNARHYYWYVNGV